MEEQMTGDEIAASLSFATHLSDGLAMSQSVAPESEEMAQEGMENTEEPATTEQPQEADIEALVEAKVEEKMNELSEKLTSALAEEDEDGQEDED